MVFKAKQSAQVTAPAPSAPIKAPASTSPLAERRAMLSTGRERALVDLAGLREQHAVAIETMLISSGSEFETVSARVDELARAITAQESRLGVFAQMQAKIDAEARERAKAARIAAAAGERAAVVAMMEARRTKLAPAIDVAFQRLLEAVVQYREAGKVAEEHARSALASEYSDSIYHMHDAFAIQLPRVSGSGSDAAVAMAVNLKRIAEAFGGSALEDFIVFNSFMPKQPTTLAAAAAIDRQTLSSFFLGGAKS
jgi:hypothetical protein